MKMYIMRGPSGYGKSTEARKLQAATDATIVSRDIIRQMLGATEKTALDTAGERRVTKMEHALIREAFNRGESVIIDNMNLDNRRAAAYADLAHLQGVPFEVRNVFNLDTELCVQRSPLPESVVRRQCVKALKMRPLNDYVRVPLMTPVQQDKGLPPVYLTDVDGTIAHIDKKNPRSPYDYSRVQEDLPDKAVTPVVNALSYRFEVFVVSGRSEDCRAETEQWLRDNKISYDALYMRRSGDDRHDAVIKREILDEIVKTRYVLGVFDDRERVVDGWLTAGLKVFDVGGGVAKF